METIIVEDKPNKPVASPKARVIAILIAISIPLLAIFLITRSIGGIKLINPYDTKLTVEIDGDEYTLWPNEEKRISISPGKYKAKSWLDGKLLMDTTVEVTADLKEEGGIINLSKQSLYVWTINYNSSTLNMMNSMKEKYIESNSGNVDSARLDMFPKDDSENELNIILVDSTAIIGNVKEFPATQCTIIRDWYYDINSPFEKEIKSSNSYEMQKSVSKLFTKNGLLLFWKQELDKISGDDDILTTEESYNQDTAAGKYK